MSVNLLRLALKNLTRSKLRASATAGCCLISALVICFFFAAESSLAGVLKADNDLNLVTVQKYKY